MSTSKTLINLGISGLSLALLIGCARHREIVQKDLKNHNAQYVGQHSDELLKTKGVPDLTSRLSTGEEVWTYRSIKTGERKGISMTISTGNAKNVKKPIISWTETVSFIIGKDGIVQNLSTSVE